MYYIAHLSSSLAQDHVCITYTLAMWLCMNISNLGQLTTFQSHNIFSSVSSTCNVVINLFVYNLPTLILSTSIQNY